MSIYAILVVFGLKKEQSQRLQVRHPWVDDIDTTRQQYDTEMARYGYVYDAENAWIAQGYIVYQKNKKRLQHLSFAYGHPLHYSIRLLAA
jgi:hypothetical protein